MKQELVAVAAAQGGVFTRRQALSNGYRGTQVRARIGTDWINCAASTQSEGRTTR